MPGGGATGAIKNVDSELDFFAGGVTASDKVFTVAPNYVQSLSNFLLLRATLTLNWKLREKRILFSDAGGYATAALKHVNANLDFLCWRYCWQ